MVGLIALCLGYVLSQFFRSVLAVLVPALVGDIGMTKPELSLASGVWFAAFAGMQFAVGVWLDRYGPRRTSALLLGLAGGGGVSLLAMAQTPAMVIAAMGLIGIGCSAVLMAAFYIFGRSFAPRHFAVLASVFIGVGSLGNIGAAAPLAFANEMLGWRAVMGWLALFTALIAVAIWMKVDDPEPDGDGGSGGLSGYFELLAIRQLWPLLPMLAISYSVAASIRGLWAGPMLADVHGANAVLIGEVTFFMAVAMAAGSFLHGPLDTIFNSRKRVMIASVALGLAAVVFLMLFPAASVPLLGIAFVAIGIAGTNYGVIIAHAKGFFPPHLTGRGMTLMNFFTIGGVAVVQAASGLVVGVAETHLGVEETYQALFGFYAVIIAAALVIYSFSRDVKPGLKDP